MHLEVDLGSHSRLRLVGTVCFFPETIGSRAYATAQGLTQTNQIVKPTGNDFNMSWDTRHLLPAVRYSQSHMEQKVVHGPLTLNPDFRESGPGVYFTAHDLTT